MKRTETLGCFLLKSALETFYIKPEFLKENKKKRNFNNNFIITLFF